MKNITQLIYTKVLTSSEGLDGICPKDPLSPAYKQK